MLQQPAVGSTPSEVNVDDNRIYLTGHSMGGAGSYFLGSKHADSGAAIAAGGRRWSGPRRVLPW